MSDERAQRCHAGLNLERADGGGKESVYNRKLQGMVVHSSRECRGDGTASARKRSGRGTRRGLHVVRTGRGEKIIIIIIKGGGTEMVDLATGW